MTPPIALEQARSGSVPSQNPMLEVWKRILSTAGAKAYGIAVGVLSLSLTSRLLGPDGRGTVAALQTWVTAFMTFSYLSLGQVALHRLAQDGLRERYGSILGALGVVTVAASLLGWSVALGVFLTWHNGPLAAFAPVALAVAFLSLPFLIWEQYGSSLLMALERLDIANRYQVIGRTLSVASLYLFLAVLDWSLVGALFAALIGQVVVAAGGVNTLFTEARLRKVAVVPTASELRALLVGGSKLHVNAIGSFLFGSANLLLLHEYSGAKDTGFYSLANQLISIMLIVPQAASMVVYGRVSQQGPDAAWPANRRILLQVAVVMLFGSAAAALVAPLLVDILAGASFAESARIFRWLLITVPGNVASALMAPQWIGRGYFVPAAAITLLTGLLNICAGYYLIPRHGIDGAIEASILTYTLALLGNGLMFRHCQLKSQEKP
jgi:O-antigen/teichoic acid export membrane protein